MMVYRYGALKPEVTQGGTFEDLLEYQRLSNVFYNLLVEIERWRIAARDIVEILQGDRLTDEQKTEHRLAYNVACCAAGQATTLGWGQKQAVTEMVAAAMKTRRKDEFKASQKASRKAWPWLKRVVACARPRFRRFDGEGILAATVQSATKLTTEQAFSPPRASCPVKISPPLKQLSRGREHRTVTLRLRDGLSIEVPIVYHRPLPPDCKIIFARLMIDRIGDRWVYSVHFTINASAPARQTGIGKCAINFGWRRVPGRPATESEIRSLVASGMPRDQAQATVYGAGVRVAYAVDDQGNESSCVIPEKLLGRQKHAESLRSLADSVAVVYLGDARGRARHRREALADPASTHPELGRERFGLDQAALKDPADREQWARRDRHLYQWERDEYAKALRARREIYRLWAREILKKYDSCVVETFDMRSVVTRAPDKNDIPAARHYRFLVGPHYLRAEIKSVFGAACEVLAPAKRTLTCHACGKLCKWDKARELRHDCESCGASWDQDANNAQNQLLDAAE